jgi:hypothetical protein
VVQSLHAEMVSASPRLSEVSALHARFPCDTHGSPPPATPQCAQSSNGRADIHAWREVLRDPPGLGHVLHLHGVQGDEERAVERALQRLRLALYNSAEKAMSARSSRHSDTSGGDQAQSRSASESERKPVSFAELSDGKDSISRELFADIVEQSALDVDEETHEALFNYLAWQGRQRHFPGRRSRAGIATHIRRDQWEAVLGVSDIAPAITSRGLAGDIGRGGQSTKDREALERATELRIERVTDAQIREVSDQIHALSLYNTRTEEDLFAQVTSPPTPLSLTDLKKGLGVHIRTLLPTRAAPLTAPFARTQFDMDEDDEVSELDLVAAAGEHEVPQPPPSY